MNEVQGFRNFFKYFYKYSICNIFSHTFCSVSIRSSLIFIYNFCEEKRIKALKKQYRVSSKYAQQEFFEQRSKMIETKNDRALVTYRCNVTRIVKHITL